MACITKLAGGFGYDCDTGVTGIKNALIINREDISSVSFESAAMVSRLVLEPGAKVYKIDTPKRVLVITESLKTNEGAPNALSFSATITITSQGSSALDLSVLQSLPNGSFVILTKEANGKCRVYGLYYGLSSSAYDRSTADNGGWVTVTLATPEQFIGEDNMSIYSSFYETLYGAAVY